MRRIAVASVVAALMAAVVSAQQPASGQSEAPPPVTFRVEVNYVEIDAVVTDAQGRVVSNLTQDDFDLLEDGRPQKITSFSLVNLPIEKPEKPLFASVPIQTDVQANTGSEGRVYLIVLDDLHTAPQRSYRVKAALHRFFEQSFGVNDLAAVVFTSGRARDSQDFTNDVHRLLLASDKFIGRKLRSGTLERIDQARADPNTGQMVPGDDPHEQERAMEARNAMASVRKLAEFMAGVRGRRKAMLFISEGVDYDINQVMGVEGSTASSVILDTQDAIAAATRGNVVIYSLDPRGLVTGTEDLIEASSTFEDQGVGEISARNELRLSQDSLRVLAAETGGFASVNRNDFDSAFDRIVRENSSYYLLGYYPANEKRDGRFRKVQVRVKRPGLMVRSRSGYYAARGRAASTKPTPSKALNVAIDEALASPLPRPGLPMKVFAGAYKGPAPNAAVVLAVEIDGSKLDFVENGGAFHERIEIVNTAVDVNNKLFPGERQTLNLALKPANYERVKDGGVRLLTAADLPPGRYQLRVAAGNANGKAGSVIYDLDVPDFFKDSLSMSGIALTSESAAQVVTVSPKNPLKDLLPGPATASREFVQSDTLVAFGEVYENQRGADHKVDITTELRADGGRVVWNGAEERASSELKGSSGGYGFTSRVPLADIPPGLYVLHIEAQSRAGDQPKVSRDILIKVK
jgi:VWFA-related protein